MELKQAGEKTYYIKHDTNIGVYKTGDHSVCLIDTGSKGDGEKIDEIITSQGWNIDYIINTHTHIDHLGGNEFLMKKYGIPAYCTAYDMAFAHYSELEAAYMFGGNPAGKLRHIFTHPGKIGFKALEDNKLDGISWEYLPGHTFGMVGVKTDDDVWFLADSYLNKRYMEKRRFGYLYDVGGYLSTLEFIKKLDGRLFIPAHGIAETDITEIADLNRENIEWMIEQIKTLCSDHKGLDSILKGLFEILGMRCNVANHALLSSTTKCYLTYLQDRGELECKFVDNVMMWKTV